MSSPSGLGIDLFGVGCAGVFVDLMGVEQGTGLEGVLSEKLGFLH